MSDETMVSAYDPNRSIRARRRACAVMMILAALGACGVLYLLATKPPEARIKPGLTLDCTPVLDTSFESKLIYDDSDEQLTLDLTRQTICNANRIERLGWSLVLTLCSATLGLAAVARRPRGQ